MSSRWPRIAVVFACLGALSGCDLGFGELGQAISCGVRGAFEGISNAFGPTGAPIESDTGGHTATVSCGGDECTRREVLRGSTLYLELDLTENALDAGIDAPEDPADIALVSSAHDVMHVDSTEVARDGCSDHLWAASAVTFRAEGEAALVVRYGGAERARFSFTVHDATSIDLVGVIVDTSEEMRELVSAPTGSLVRIVAIVRNAAGTQLSTGGEVHFWVDDPEVAGLTFPRAGSTASGQGAEQLIALEKPGTTRVHALVSNLTDTLEVVVGEGAVPAPDEDAGTDDAVAGGEGARP